MGSCVEVSEFLATAKQILKEGMLGDTSEVRSSDLGLALGLSWGSVDPSIILGLVI